MKALNLTFAAVLAVCLTGCSSDPSASDFERFAREYGEKVSAIDSTRAGKSMNVDAELIGHDLRKTDSLTSPYVGTAIYRVTVSDIAIAHQMVPDYEAKARYVTEATVAFGFQDKQWQPMKAEGKFVDSAVTDKPAALTAKLGRIDDGSTHPIPLEDVAEGRIYQLNGFVSLDPEMLRATARPKLTE